MLLPANECGDAARPGCGRWQGDHGDEVLSVSEAFAALQVLFTWEEHLWPLCFSPE